MFIKKIKDLLKPKVKVLNEIFIDKKAILNNIEVIKSFQPNANFFPVLKSNAYWHWLLQTIEILKWQNFPYIVVDSFPEYQAVIKNSNFKILLLAETIPENYKFFNFKRTTFVVYNEETIEELWSFNKKVKIHLFLNTWMNREWVQKNKLEVILEKIKKFENIELEWVMSHFHSADKWWDFSASLEQIEKFKEMYQTIENFWFSPKWRHIWASSWIIRMEDDFFNAFRPWIILFWYNPLSFWIKWKTNLLKPSLTLTSTIVCLQEVEAWEWIWYLFKSKAQKKSLVWIIPFGYYEWLNRRFSWKMTFSYNWKYITQVGMISMNMTNFYAKPETKIWEKVEIISPIFPKKNSVYNISKDLQVSPYELLVKLDKSIRRTIIK